MPNKKCIVNILIGCLIIPIVGLILAFIGLAKNNGTLVLTGAILCVTTGVTIGLSIAFLSKSKYFIEESEFESDYGSDSTQAHEYDSTDI
jgi:uncharacterized membrane protein